MLRTHPAVKDVCVVGRADSDLGEVPVAFVVGELSHDQATHFLSEKGLARYKWPEIVVRIDDLPLSGPGKVNRKALRERAGAL